MTEADPPSTSGSSWIAVGCGLEFVLIALRAVSIWYPHVPVWACAWPAYLPLQVALVAFLSPIGLVALVIAARRPAHEGVQERSIRYDGARWLPFAIPIVVYALPDRAGFVGDYLLRRGAVLAGNYTKAFPQSLPLDRLFQSVVVPWLGASPQDAALRGARLLGLTSGAIMALLSVRSIDWPVPRSRFTALISLGLAGGGYVCVLTGYARDWTEMLPLVLALLWLLRTRVMERRRLSPAPEFLLAGILLLHRSGLFLVPAYVLATYKHPLTSRGTARQREAWLLGVGALVLVAAISATRYVHIVAAFDLSRHAPWATVAGAPRPPIADPHAMWDILNAVVLLAPA